MKRFLRRMTGACLIASMLAVPAHAAGEEVRVGLFYGSSALAAPQLQNAEGSGYLAGYYDGEDVFHSLYPIAQDKVVMLKDANYIRNADDTYAEGASGGAGTIGAYHVQLPQSYDTPEAARAGAQAAGAGAFVAYLGGTYYVRTGQYPSQSAAQAAAGTSGGAAVGGSDTGVTVVETGTNTILFEYDSNQVFAMQPQGRLTWAKGFRYYGSFAYPRTGGGNLSVINYVPLEDYVKGVVPYEMSPSWQLEALKAQAVCARSFAVNGLGKHDAQGFDVCNSTDCQVYRGANQATDHSDNAVAQTAGVTLSYQGKPAVGYYFAADGGATEDAVNVWGGEYGYLKGVIDPYEDTENAQNAIWTVQMTASEVGSKLKAAGYSLGTVADVRVTQTTETGNVLTVTVTDTAGKTVTVEKAKARSVFGLNSQRYTVTGNRAEQTTPAPQPATDSGLGTSILRGLRAAFTGGKLDASTQSGTASTPVSTPVSTVSTSFTFSGRGWGHHVGMSQYGAKAMAEQGKTYDEILKFYFTGITLAGQ